MLSDLYTLFVQLLIQDLQATFYLWRILDLNDDFSVDYKTLMQMKQ